MKGLSRVDGWVGATRPLWVGLGQWGLVILGIHLAADRLDDGVLAAIVALELPVGSSDSFEAAAGWAAVTLELITALCALSAIALTSHLPALSAKLWWERRSIKSFALSVFWPSVALAGAWVVGMSVEDAIAPFAPRLAFGLGLAVTVVVAWRLGYTGLIRVLGGLDEPKRRTQGLLLAPLLLLITVVTIQSLPIWGWLS